MISDSVSADERRCRTAALLGALSSVRPSLSKEKHDGSDSGWGSRLLTKTFNPFLTPLVDINTRFLYCMAWLRVSPFIFTCLVSPMAPIGWEAAEMSACLRGYCNVTTRRR
jgi:hypothetical protein